MKKKKKKKRNGNKVAIFLSRLAKIVNGALVKGCFCYLRNSVQELEDWNGKTVW